MSDGFDFESGEFPLEEEEYEGVGDGEAEDLLSELNKQQLVEDLNDLASPTSAGKLPVWLIVKVVKVILVLLISIFKLLTNRRFGLKEIKREIREIEKKLDGKKVPEIVTTGPVGRNAGVGSIVVKILNNSDARQTLTIVVYGITKCPKVAVATRTVKIPPCCAETFIFVAPLQYEVEVSGLVKGVYVWAAARLQPPVSPLLASQYVAANTFRHHEFVKQVVCPLPYQQG